MSTSVDVNSGELETIEFELDEESYNQFVVMFPSEEQQTAAISQGIDQLRAMSPEELAQWLAAAMALEERELQAA